MNKLSKTAFTLIELLVVIAIIGILSGLIVFTMNGVTSKANIAKSQVFNNSLRNALMLNLVSEWRFDELSSAVQGSSIQDSWSGGNNMILSTNSDGLDKLKTGTNCVFGNCLSFDGTNDYAYVSGSDSSSSNLAITGAITLSAWVKFDAAGTIGTIISRGIYFNGDGNYGFVLWRNGSNNRLYFTTYSTVRDIFFSNSLIADTDWHYIVATWDGTTNANGKKLYIDGAMDRQQASTISIIGQPGYEFRIGAAGNGSNFLSGRIDEARVYNAALPSSQIKEQYNAGLNNLLASGSISNAEYQSRLSIISKK